MSAGFGIAIGVSILSRRHPRLLFWLLAASLCGFIPLSVWVTSGEIQQFQDARAYAAAHECATGGNCYQTEPATVIRTTVEPDSYQNSRQAVVTLQVGGGQPDVRLDDRNAWMNAHVADGESIRARVWRGRVTQLIRGGTAFRSIDFPSFDWSNVLIALLAWSVTGTLIYMAYATRKLIKVTRLVTAPG